MIELKTPQEIKEMRPAGKFVGSILKDLKAMTKVGTNLLEIDEFVKQRIEARNGAESCYVDYAPDFGTGPFAHYICTSVNDAVLHGVPYDYNLKDGDLISLDLAINVDGWVGDSAISFVVGKNQDPEDLRLIKCTEDALAAGIAQAKAGNRLGDISAAIGDIARSQGYTVNLEFGGHGVGHIMHGDPHVPNDGKAHHGYKLRPGLVIAIEPWFLKTTDEIYQDPKDGWTLRSSDGSRGAHTEHTIAITDGEPIILTARD
ncbi:type I methionyl aminopeptidase [Bifidobacterium primatium]|uniref:Methionine aminopeptidase n=2 Tax=Bifidobacterium TaxID=1678 RepID=A0A2M9H9J7_9BIFI|nr:MULTISPECIES: type I methionyl aminopeptidase [Bifidobacterium]NEG96692.1 type I methionyl aminopeptidase [Bifidobacterium sp. SMB2]NEH11848.1 type I methionyl aminopeptidase [Bifidobacterium saimiriisciurei]PJM73485.1 type I methionyl aminopeptidase [Bifidobacterium primatium]